MIVFGWGGGRVKDHGQAPPQRCPSCGHDGFLHYFTVTKWFRLYFIPIIPYSTKHFLACPLCTAGAELTTAAERERVHTLVATTASLNSGLLAPGSYAEQVRSALGRAAPTPLPRRPQSKPLLYWHQAKRRTESGLATAGRVDLDPLRATGEVQQDERPEDPEHESGDRQALPARSLVRLRDSDRTEDQSEDAQDRDEQSEDA